ncbi:copper amine oxidase N-terminal domain-containing protein [Paenibacillus agri]|uniref:Copper amine oxidase N-terminal domain-containing protein n=1 Tax=Paenibacillus agri TaxID=2744309 RepID=A0A850ESH5_9BACL|nr:copper amine oxidase N-terminal domain-containing protein [Paenibacillus agri]NUU62477.1 copper amine oxidase N-terminal domain-containing protein [Paenibacillus agri]
MKKQIVTLAAATFIFASLQNVSFADSLDGNYDSIATAQNQQNLASKTIDLSDTGVIYKSSSLIPATSIFKAFGGVTEFDAKAGSIKLTLGKDKFVGKVNDKVYYLNGVKRALTTSPQIINGKLMIPVQVLKDAFKSKINKEGDYLTIQISNVTVNIYIDPNYEMYSVYLNKTLYFYNVYYNAIDANTGNIVNIKNLSAIYINKIDTLDNGNVKIWFTQNKKYYYSTVDYNDLGDSKENPFLTKDVHTIYKYSAAVWTLIETNNIKAGMDKTAVILSWGVPDRKNESSSGFMDQWVYEQDEETVYVYFTNGVMKSWSSSDY